MNYINLIFILSSLFFSCKGKTKEIGVAIVKEAFFIESKMQVDAISSDEVWVDITFKNNSNDTFVFYKPLLPTSELTEKVFSVFSLDTYDTVPFNRFKSEKYLGDEAEEVGKVIPKIVAENLIKLSPDSIWNGRLNIALFYNFKSSIKQGEHLFAIAYSIYTPFFTGNEQVYEIDTIDRIKKPVYYNLTANRSDDVDSVRVRFRLQK